MVLEGTEKRILLQFCVGEDLPRFWEFLNFIYKIDCSQTSRLQIYLWFHVTNVVVVEHKKNRWSRFIQIWKSCVFYIVCHLFIDFVDFDVLEQPEEVVKKKLSDFWVEYHSGWKRNGEFNMIVRTIAFTPQTDPLNGIKKYIYLEKFLVKKNSERRTSRIRENEIVLCDLEMYCSTAYLLLSESRKNSISAIASTRLIARHIDISAIAFPWDY